MFLEPRVNILENDHCASIDAFTMAHWDSSVEEHMRSDQCEVKSHPGVISPFMLGFKVDIYTVVYFQGSLS